MKREEGGEVTVLTKIAISAVALVALFVIASNSSDEAATRPVESGFERFDSVLQHGLSRDTHDRLSERLSDSAEFLGAVESKVTQLPE